MKPPASTILPWLRSNLGRAALAPLTSTDTRALLAAVSIAELWLFEPSAPVAAAFKNVVMQMQPETRYLAFHSVAHVGDWGRRWQLWKQAELDPLPRIPCCKYGPQPTPAVQK